MGNDGTITSIYASVVKRIRETGIMKIIGAQNKHILFLRIDYRELVESICLLTGFGIGYALSKIVSRIGETTVGASLCGYRHDKV